MLVATTSLRRSFGVPMTKHSKLWRSFTRTISYAVVSPSTGSLAHSCAFPITTFPLVLSTEGRTPVPTHHPSAPSFEANKEEYKVLSAVTPKSHSEAKKRVRLSNFPTFSN